ncbi:hypothetical protein CCP2SC5_60060 [Azospirillaceae bacterium]
MFLVVEDYNGEWILYQKLFTALKKDCFANKGGFRPWPERLETQALDPLNFL